MLKLNTETRLASFYRYAYLTAEMPKTVCTYHFRLIIAFLMLPINWIPMLLNRMFIPISLFERKIFTKNQEPMVFKEYFVFSKSFSVTHGFIYSIFAPILGVSYVICFDLGFLLGNTKSFIIGVSKLYAIGVGFTGIAMLIVYGVYRLIKFTIETETTACSPFKKRAKNIAKIRREHKRAERRLNPNFFDLLCIRFKSWKESKCVLIEWSYENDNNKQ